MKQPKGFTLVEMLVAISIFSIVIVVVADLFARSNQVRMRASINQEVQGNAQLIMGQLTDRFRSGTVDYDAYGGQIVNIQEDTFYFIDEQGVNTVVTTSSDLSFCPDAKSIPCIVISEDGGANFQSLTPSGVRVPKLDFYIDPPQSPTESNGKGFVYDIQPRVTIVVGLQSTIAREDLAKIFYFQTSVSSRVLLR